MKLSRGGFLRISGAALLGRCVEIGSLLGAVAASAATPELERPHGRLRLEDVSSASFRPHVTTTFAVRTSSGAQVPLVLAQITERPLDNDVEQFSLLFTQPQDAAVLHGTYGFHHPALGAFDLFIAPVGAANARDIVHEACFSRHVTAAERVARRLTGRSAQPKEAACRTHS